jgi:hypothetical protein
MKKRIILPGIFTVFAILTLTTPMIGSNHFPENPYSSEFVLAA